MWIAGCLVEKIDTEKIQLGEWRHFSVRRLLDDWELTKLKYSYQWVKTMILAISYEISEVRTFHQMDTLPSHSLIFSFHGKWMEELEKKTRSCLLIRLWRGILFFPEVRTVLCGNRAPKMHSHNLGTSIVKKKQMRSWNNFSFFCHLKFENETFCFGMCVSEETMTHVRIDRT